MNKDIYNSRHFSRREKQTQSVELFSAWQCRKLHH